MKPPTNWLLGLCSRVLEVLVLRADEDKTNPRRKPLDPALRDHFLRQIRAIKTREDFEAARQATSPFAMGQIDLSRRSNVSPTQVGMILRGEVDKNLALRTVLAIAEGAGVSPTWLITGEGPREVLKDDRYPARLRACRAAAELGIDPRWIQMAHDRATFVDGYFDPPDQFFWFDWMYASQRAGRPARLQASLKLMPPAPGDPEADAAGEPQQLPLLPERSTASTIDVAVAPAPVPASSPTPAQGTPPSAASPRPRGRARRAKKRH